MSESVVRVDLRQATLSENARLREAGDMLFLAIENPPPVRCLLRLISGDEVEAFEVARVIEVVDEIEPARGCYGRHVELERLDEQRKVGSEHLEAGITGGGGGIPAPVVIMNTAEMMLGEAGEDSEALAAGDSGDESGESSEPESSESESGDESGESSEPDSSEPESSEPGSSEPE